MMLIEILMDFFNRQAVKINRTAKVVSVDEEARTCAVRFVDDNSVDEDVRLNAVINSTNVFLLVPKVGSMVTVGSLFNLREENFVSAYSEVDKIKIKTLTVEIDADSTVFNGGNNGGLVIVQELVNKINALEEMVNNMLNVLKTTSIPLAPAGTYPFAPLYASMNAIAPLTAKADLENPKIKH